MWPHEHSACACGPMYTVLVDKVLHCLLIHCGVVWCTVLYCTALYCTVLHCTVFYSTVLCCTVLYCTVLYCTVLYGADLDVEVHTDGAPIGAALHGIEVILEFHPIGATRGEVGCSIGILVCCTLRNQRHGCSIRGY